MHRSAMLAALCAAALVAGASAQLTEVSMRPAEAFVHQAAAAVTDAIHGAADLRGPHPSAEAWQDVDKQWCPKQAAFEFIPVLLGHVTVDKPLQFAASCYADAGSNTATLTMNATGFTVTFANDGKPSSLLCSDALTIVSREKIHLHSNTALGGKTQVLSAAFANADEGVDVKSHGLAVYTLPCGLLGTLTSVLSTVGLFSGATMVQNNVDFLNYRKVFDPPMTVRHCNRACATACCACPTQPCLMPRR